MGLPPRQGDSCSDQDDDGDDDGDGDGADDDDQAPQSFKSSPNSELHSPGYPWTSTTALQVIVLLILNSLLQTIITLSLSL